MKIKTAQDLGLEVIDRDYIHDRKLSRKILGLTGFQIQVSEAVLELMIDGSREKTLLKVIFESDELRASGLALTQDEFGKIAVKCARQIFTDEATAQNLAENATFQEMRRKLNLDLPLNIKTDKSTMENEQTDTDMVINAGSSADQIVIIATEDEINSERGAMILAGRAQTSLASANPLKLFSTPEGRKKLDDLVETKMLDLSEKMINLPTIADDDEFEKNLRSLSFVMKGSEAGRQQFINIATGTFADRPVRSRKAIAEVMIRYGLNPKLMENIVFLCSERPAKLQIEAINMVVKTMAETARPTETMMAAVTLAKILEEDAKPEVRRRALECLTEKANVVLEQLPHFLEDNRVVPMVKTMLITAPADYRRHAETFLMAFGQKNARAIATELNEDLDAITDPHVLITYYSVLEFLSEDWEKNKLLAQKKWHLCFQHRHDHPGILTECEERFRAALPNSLDLLYSIIPEFSPEDQVYFIELLDQNFAWSVKNHRDSAAKQIAGYFVRQLAEEKLSGAANMAIMKTGAVLHDDLPDAYHEMIWRFMKDCFGLLCQDKKFVEQFISTGRILFEELVTLSRQTTDDNAKNEFLPIIYKKLAAIQPSGRRFELHREGLLNAVKELSEEISMLFSREHSAATRKILFRGIAGMADSPLADADTVYSLCASAVIACEGTREGAEELLATYKSVEKSAHIEEKTVQLFSEAFVRGFNVNSDVTFKGVQKLSESPAMTEKLLVKTFIGLGKSIKDPDEFLPQLLKAYTVFAKSPVLHAEIARHMLDFFLKAIRDNVPPPPDPDGFEPTADDSIKQALAGLLTLCRTGKLDEGRIGYVKKTIVAIIAARPEKVMTKYVQGCPAVKVPDHYKQELQTFLTELE